MIKQCSWCGADIKVCPSKISKNNFCNREHYQLFHSKNVKTYKCEVCGKDFRSNLPSNANRFCSRECYDKQHNIINKNRICPGCEKIFTAKTSEDKYCSIECYNNNREMPKGEEHWNWQGGISQGKRDSNEYKQWRKEVYDRDGYKCVFCGSKELLNAHHILSYKYYPDKRFVLENGITVCQECHIKIHQKYGYDTDEPMNII